MCRVLPLSKKVKNLIEVGKKVWQNIHTYAYYSIFG